jgi:hypothetical protein
LISAPVSYLTTIISFEATYSTVTDNELQMVGKEAAMG